SVHLTMDARCCAVKNLKKPDLPMSPAQEEKAEELLRTWKPSSKPCDSSTTDSLAGDYGLRHICAKLDRRGLGSLVDTVGGGNMLRILGRISSINVQKVVWCARELGLAFERTDVGGAFGGTDTPAYRTMNPNGLVPVIDDDGFVMWESNA